MYQELFIQEARAAMGQPNLDEIERYLGYRVVIWLSHTDERCFGTLMEIKGDFVVLDKGDPIPWRGIEKIRLAKSHKNTIVRHVLDHQGEPLCGRKTASEPPEPNAPICAPCRRSRAFWEPVEGS
jgi:hypothetical protein